MKRFSPYEVQAVLETRLSSIPTEQYNHLFDVLSADIEDWDSKSQGEKKNILLRFIHRADNLHTKLCMIGLPLGYEQVLLKASLNFSMAQASGVVTDLREKRKLKSSMKKVLGASIGVAAGIASRPLIIAAVRHAIIQLRHFLVPVFKSLGLVNISDEVISHAAQESLDTVGVLSGIFGTTIALALGLGAGFYGAKQVERQRRKQEWANIIENGMKGDQRLKRNVLKRLAKQMTPESAEALNRYLVELTANIGLLDEELRHLDGHTESSNRALFAYVMQKVWDYSLAHLCSFATSLAFLTAKATVSLYGGYLLLSARWSSGAYYTLSQLGSDNISLVVEPVAKKLADKARKVIVAQQKIGAASDYVSDGIHNGPGRLYNRVTNRHPQQASKEELANGLGLAYQSKALQALRKSRKTFKKGSVVSSFAVIRTLRAQLDLLSQDKADTTRDIMLMAHAHPQKEKVFELISTVLWHRHLATEEQSYSEHNAAIADLTKQLEKIHLAVDDVSTQGAEQLLVFNKLITNSYVLVGKVQAIEEQMAWCQRGYLAVILDPHLTMTVKANELENKKQEFEALKNELKKFKVKQSEVKRKFDSAEKHFAAIAKQHPELVEHKKAYNELVAQRQVLIEKGHKKDVVNPYDASAASPKEQAAIMELKTIAIGIANKLTHVKQVEKEWQKVFDLNEAIQQDSALLQAYGSHCRGIVKNRVLHNTANAKSLRALKLDYRVCPNEILAVLKKMTAHIMKNKLKKIIKQQKIVDDYLQKEKSRPSWSTDTPIVSIDELEELAAEAKQELQALREMQNESVQLPDTFEKTVHVLCVALNDLGWEIPEDERAPLSWLSKKIAGENSEVLNGSSRQNPMYLQQTYSSEREIELAKPSDLRATSSAGDFRERDTNKSALSM